MPWTLRTLVFEAANVQINGRDGQPNVALQHQRNAARTLLREIDLLQLQQCPYCDGFGHAGNLCPLDAKLTLLRMGGTIETRQLLTRCRKDARTAKNLADNRSYSRLSAHAGFMLKKRTRTNQYDFADIQPPRRNQRTNGNA